jgi:hypothetical protein
MARRGGTCTDAARHNDGNGKKNEPGPTGRCQQLLVVKEDGGWGVLDEARATTEVTETEGVRDGDSLVATERESGSRFVRVMTAGRRGDANATARAPWGKHVERIFRTCGVTDPSASITRSVGPALLYGSVLAAVGRMPTSANVSISEDCLPSMSSPSKKRPESVPPDFKEGGGRDGGVDGADLSAANKKDGAADGEMARKRRYYVEDMAIESQLKEGESREGKTGFLKHFDIDLLPGMATRENDTSDPAG